MGGRAGGGAGSGRGGGAGINYDYTGGFEKAPFKGAPRAKDLKVGDVLGAAPGKTTTFLTKVVKIDKLAKNKLLITTNTGGVSSHVIIKPSSYVGGQIVK